MLNELERKQVKAIFGHKEAQDLAQRLLTHALLSSSTITAPEIRTCLNTIEDLLSTKEKKVNAPIRDAE